MLLLAPNGNPSNLNPVQHKLVRTKAFKDWFGDWENNPNDSSKIVDENGEPLVVYHGTNREFNVFDNKEITSNSGNSGHYGEGFYFSFELMEAKTYTNRESPKILNCFLDVKNPFDAFNTTHLERYSKEFGFEKSDVAVDPDWMKTELKSIDLIAYKMYSLVLDNGYEKGWKLFMEEYPDGVNQSKFDLNEISDIAVEWSNTDSDTEVPEYILEYLESYFHKKPKLIRNYTTGNEPRMIYMTDYGQSTNYITELIKKDGFDGIVAGTEIVLFESNQIKLADGSNTTFDLNNDDIRFNDGGNISKLIAPNGKPSNLNPVQYKVVRTKSFKDWFGDWERSPKKSSLIVDDNGEPKLMYHGTGLEEWSEYDLSSKRESNSRAGGSWGKGIYLTSNKEEAIKYSKNGKVLEFFCLSKSLKKYDAPLKKADKKTIETAKELVKIEIEKSDYPDKEYALKKYLFDLEYDLKKGKIPFLSGFITGDIYRQIMLLLGYDSVQDGLSHLVLYNSNQIKLADGSNTTFDVNSNDIRYDNGGKLPKALIAPNGKHSNLNEIQYNLVRTEAFKNWFGDWENNPNDSSKVVDENGEPLVVYHGSDDEFNKFKKGKNVFTRQTGFYFSDNKNVSQKYGDIVKPFFINLKDVITYDAEDLSFSEAIEKFPELEEDLMKESELSIDGVIIENVYDSPHGKKIGENANTYCVYDSHNIKLANGKNTTFDIESNDIRYKKGGSITKSDMVQKEETVTLDSLIRTPAGGVLIGKDKEGQTIIPEDGTMGGFLVGRLHKENGIKAVNKSNGQPLEMQGNEVVITAPAVADQSKRQFEGKMMTNREILSKINSDGGGVSFAEGGEIPAKIHISDKQYDFEGNSVNDVEIAHQLGCNSTLKNGNQMFTYNDTTFDVAGIYEAFASGNISYEVKNISPFPMKYNIYDKHYSENVVPDFNNPQGLMVVLDNEEEVLIDGNHRMNNAYINKIKSIPVNYVSIKEINDFTTKNNFAEGGNIDKKTPKVKLATVNKIKKLADRIVEIESYELGNEDDAFSYNGDLSFKERNKLFAESRKLQEELNKTTSELSQNQCYSINSDSFRNLNTAGDYGYEEEEEEEYKDGGHLSKNKSLEDIAEMHDVSLYHIMQQLAMGIEVEKEHTSDENERIKIAKDHLVENPDYYTILDKAGLEKGGKVDLVKASKRGDSPSRDLNNYNDVIDVQEDGIVGNHQDFNDGDASALTNGDASGIGMVFENGGINGLVVYNEKYKDYRIKVSKSSDGKPNSFDFTIIQFQDGDWHEVSKGYNYRMVSPAVVDAQKEIDNKENDSSFSDGGDISSDYESKLKYLLNQKIKYGTITTRSKKYPFLQLYKYKDYGVNFGFKNKEDKITVASKELVLCNDFDFKAPYYFICYEPSKHNQISNQVLITTDYKTLTKALADVFDAEFADCYVYKNNTSEFVDSESIDSIYQIYPKDEVGVVIDKWVKNQYAYEYEQSVETELIKENVNKSQDMNNNNLTNWNEVPSIWKDTSKVKKVTWINSPYDKGLYSIIQPFLGDVMLRPIMSGINFDANGITVSDAHKLITLPYPNSKYEGVYKSDLSKKKDSEQITIDTAYYNYAQIIPKENVVTASYKISVYKLLQYIKVALKYADKKTNYIIFKAGENKIGYNGEFLMDVLKTLLKLGHEHIYLNYTASNRASLFTVKKEYELGNDEIILLMPIKIAEGDQIGAEDADNNRKLSVYYDFSTDEIYNADGTIAEFKMNYKNNVVMPSEDVKLLKKFTTEKKHSNDSMLVRVENKTALAISDELNNYIRLKDIDLSKGLYNVVDTVLEPTMTPIEDYPEVPLFVEDDKTIEFTIDSEVLEYYFDKLKLAVGKDDLRPVMKGILLHYTTDNRLYLVATDANVLLKIEITDYVTIGKYDFEAKYILNPKYINIFLDNVENHSLFISSNRRKTLIECAKADLYTENIDGNYPNYEAIIPRYLENKITLDLSETKKCLNGEKSKSYIKSNNRETPIIFHNEDSLMIGITIGNTTGEILKEEALCNIKINVIDENYSYNSGSMLLVMPFLDRNKEYNFAFKKEIFDKIIDIVSDGELVMHYTQKNSAYMIPIHGITFDNTKKTTKKREQKPTSAQIEAVIKEDQKSQENSEINEAIDILHLLSDSASTDEERNEIEEALEILEMLQTDSFEEGGSIEPLSASGNYSSNEFGDTVIETPLDTFSDKNSKTPKHNEITIEFLNSIDSKTKNEILSNIANHYGITKESAYEEITDEESESLMDYITGEIRPAISLLFQKFKAKK